jgi:hypothetical protein
MAQNRCHQWDPPDSSVQRCKLCGSWCYRDSDGSISYIGAAAEVPDRFTRRQLGLRQLTRWDRK